MKYSLASSILLAIHAHTTVAFAPSSFAKTSLIQRSAVDPSFLADAHHHADAISSMFSSMNLADAADAVADAANVAPAVTDAVPAVADVASNAVAPAAMEAADAVAKNDNGWFGFLEGPIEAILGSIHSLLVGMGMSEDAWGVTIIAMTSLIKLATYPLTKQQLESTSKMQVSA